MHTLAKKRNGECLSQNYFNNKTKMRWRCKERHIWEATPGHIKQGTWCPKCGRKKVRLSNKSTVKKMRTIAEKKGCLSNSFIIKEMHALAKKRGGKFLSEIYTNSRTKLEWKCKEGHIWEALPGSIKQGTWCPIRSTEQSRQPHSAL